MSMPHGREVTMGLEPVIEITSIPGLELEVPTAPMAAVGSAARGQAPTLRAAGFVLDRQAATLRWQGTTVPLALEQRRVLEVFMERAGQILSAASLSELLGIPSTTIEDAIQSLRASLKEAGVPCRLCAAEGVGYILWY